MRDEDGHLLKLINKEFKAYVNSINSAEKWPPSKKGNPYFDNLEAIYISFSKLESIKNKLAKFNPARFLDIEGKPS
jgi:hypothetical protein